MSPDRNQFLGSKTENRFTRYLNCQANSYARVGEFHPGASNEPLSISAEKSFERSKDSLGQWLFRGSIVLLAALGVGHDPALMNLAAAMRDQRRRQIDGIGRIRTFTAVRRKLIRN